MATKGLSPEQYVAGSDRRIHHCINKARDAVFAASKRKEKVAIQDNDFEAALAGQKDAPDEAILESLYRRNLEACPPLKQMMQLYRQETTHIGAPRSFSKLQDMLRTHIVEERRLKNRREMTRAVRSGGKALSAANDDGQRTRNRKREI